MRKCKRLLLLLCAAALLAGLTAVLAAAETDGWQLTLGPTNPDLTEETDDDQYSNEAPLYIYNADFNGDASEVGYLHTSDAFLRYKYFITFAPVVGTDCYKAVQAGNNLVADWEENSVAIPEGGFVLVFYYQANPDNVADHTSPNDNNTAAYELYNYLLSTAVSNTAAAVSADAYMNQDGVVTKTLPAATTSEAESTDDSSSSAAVSSEAPVSPSTAETTSAPADDSSKTPVTGDAGAVAALVLTAAALIGAVLLVRRRHA